MVYKGYWFQAHRTATGVFGLDIFTRAGVFTGAWASSFNGAQSVVDGWDNAGGRAAYLAAWVAAGGVRFPLVNPPAFLGAS